MPDHGNDMSTTMLFLPCILLPSRGHVIAVLLLCCCHVHGNVHWAILVQDHASVFQQFVQEVILLCKVHPVLFCAHVVCGNPGGGHCCIAGGLSLRWRKGLPRTPCARARQRRRRKGLPRTRCARARPRRRHWSWHC